MAKLCGRLWVFFLCLPAFKKAAGIAFGIGVAGIDHVEGMGLGNALHCEGGDGGGVFNDRAVQKADGKCIFTF